MDLSFLAPRMIGFGLSALAIQCCFTFHKNMNNIHPFDLSYGMFCLGMIIAGVGLLG